MGRRDRKCSTCGSSTDSSQNLVKKKTMSVDWQTASERLNRFAQMNRRLQAELAILSMEQARNDKMAFKLGEARTYPMRQMNYNFVLKRQLDVEAHRPHAEKMW